MSSRDEYDEEMAEDNGCCDSCVAKIQRFFAPLSPWIAGIKNVASSGADVVTDWMFYLRIAGDETGNLTEFVWPLFAFSVLSTIYLFIVIWVELSKRCCPDCGNGFINSKIFCCCCSCMKTLKFIALLEIVTEDIPQIIISQWVRQEQAGTWNTAAIINIITSAYNIAFDIFGLFELTPQAEEKLMKNRNA